MMMMMMMMMMTHNKNERKRDDSLKKKKKRNKNALVHPVAERVHQVRAERGDATEQGSVAGSRHRRWCWCPRRRRFLLLPRQRRHDDE